MIDCFKQTIINIKYFLSLNGLLFPKNLKLCRQKWMTFVIRWKRVVFFDEKSFRKRIFFNKNLDKFNQTITL